MTLLIKILIKREKKMSSKIITLEDGATEAIKAK
jgi:hypothetical protein